MFESLTTYKAGAAPLISALFDVLGIGRILDSTLSWDQTQCKLPPSIRIKALVINILAGRTPLHRVSEFFMDRDNDNLFAQGVSYEDLNDDCLARALDMLSDANPKKVISSIMLNSLAVDNIPITHIHADTTSISVYGKYQHDGDENDDLIDASLERKVIELLRGYSKDHRPDLLQLKFGLGVNQDGIPIIGEPLSGNTDDKTWNSEFIKTMSAHLDKVDLTKVTYIADSSLVTKNGLDSIADKKLLMISRLPAVFGLEKELIDEAWKNDNWIDIGKLCNSDKGAEYEKAAYYKLQCFTRKLYDRTYSFIVVNSSSLDQRKVKALDRQITSIKKQIESNSKDISAKEFACEADAQSALKEFLEENSNEYFPLSGVITGNTRAKKRNKRGRPGKDEQVEHEAVYKISVTIGHLDESAVKKARERNNCFVLITNDLIKSPIDVLKEYKHQGSVETSFKFLKDPKYLDAIYLKKESRIEALSYVMLIALLINRIIQRRARKALSEEGSHITVCGGVKTTTPTGNRIFELLEPYAMIVAKIDGKEHRIIQEYPTREPLDRILSLVGFTRDIFLTVKPNTGVLLE